MLLPFEGITYLLIIVLTTESIYCYPKCERVVQFNLIVTHALSLSVPNYKPGHTLLKSRHLHKTSVLITGRISP